VPRVALLLWRVSDTAAETFASLVHEIATMFSASDIAWLDSRLTRLGAGPTTRHAAACHLERVARRPAGEELRLGCGSSGTGLALRGFVTLAKSTEIAGRIDALSLGQAAALQRLSVAGGKATGGNGGETVELALREGRDGLSARLASGERLSGLILRVEKSGDVTAELAVVDDIRALDQALARLAEASADSLGPGPLRRRMVLSDLDRALARR
jgi:hypothetical protein